MASDGRVQPAALDERGDFFSDEPPHERSGFDLEER